MQNSSELTLLISERTLKDWRSLVEDVNVKDTSCDYEFEKRENDLELELSIKRKKKIKGRQ